jgi:phosphoglycolate phosphatase
MGHVRRRLIAFDLDGTLVDSLRDLADSANQLIQDLGGTPVPEADIARMVGEGAAVLVRRALVAAGLGEVPGALARFREIYDTRLLTHTRPYDGIPEVVRLARQHAHVAVLTNKPTIPSERILEGLELRELFDAIVGGDGLYPRKPEPASLFALMEQVGAGPSDTLMVGDSAIDHETARRVAVRCCLTSYGFGYASFPVERLTGHEWIVPDARALASIIERFTAG